MRFLWQLGASTLAALFGAALFAVHPQLGASTGWLAARCGIGAATMTLLTAVLWMSARRREREHQSSALLKASALFAAALAPLFQESGYLALLTPLMLDLLLSKSSAKSLLRRHSMFATLGIGLLTLRYVAIGTLGGGYPNPMGLLAGGEAAQDALASGGKTLVRMVGAIPIEFFDSNRLLQIACLALTLLTVTMSLLLVRKKKGTALLRTTPPLLNPALALLALACACALHRERSMRVTRAVRRGKSTSPRTIMRLLLGSLGSRAMPRTTSRLCRAGYSGWRALNSTPAASFSLWSMRRRRTASQ
jgi:hypothetical protein